MAEKRKITIHPSFGGKKVISKQSVEKVEAEKQDQTTDDSPKTAKSKRVCFFCQNKNLPSYTDMATLRRYLTDRAKIVPKLKSNLCSKHQRRVTKQIKYARHLSLLPFTPSV